MGNKDGKPKLPKNVQAKAELIFKEFDNDNSGTISKEETMKRWNTIFARHNTEEMFGEVDSDSDGTITKDEWLLFWRIQLSNGKTPN
jgi:Ca2+-binding EF-hand superfamily protein